MRIDSTDLRLLVAAAESGSVSRAAQVVHLSVAATSERLAALEERVGQRLFDRRRTGLVITAAGQTLLRHGRAALHLLEQAQAELDETDSEHCGRVRIHANTSAVTEFMPQILGSFMAERPRVMVDLFERPLHGAMQGVAEGAVDFAIIASNEPPLAFERRKFASDRMVLVTAQGHPLGAARSLRYRDALAFPQVSLEIGTSYADFMREIRHQLGWQPTTRIELRSFEAMCIMIAAGVGVGVLPESVARRHARTMKLTIHTLREAWARRDRYVIAQSFDAMPRAAQALVHAIGRHFDRRF